MAFDAAVAWNNDNRQTEQMLEKIRDDRPAITDRQQ